MSLHTAALLLFQLATTTYDFLEEGSTAPFAVPTASLRVGMALPNQWTCGVLVTFPPEHRSHPVQDLLDFLDITVEMPGAEAVIEVDEVAGTLLVRTTAHAWYDRVQFTTLDEHRNLAETVHARLWPYQVDPPTPTLEVLPCPGATYGSAP